MAGLRRQEYGIHGPGPRQTSFHKQDTLLRTYGALDVREGEPPRRRLTA